MKKLENNEKKLPNHEGDQTVSINIKVFTILQTTV